MTSMEILTGSRKTPLPEGWRWATLGNLVSEAKSGFACGSRDPEGVIQLRMNNVDTRGNFVWDEYIRVPADNKTIEVNKLASGDVLFNNTNSTELVGKSALFEGYKETVVYSNHFTRIRTIRNALIPEFLAAWLNHQWQMCVFENICNRWIGQSAVKPDKLMNLDFPLPPLPEQKRIAGILRKRMDAVERARKFAEEQLEAVQTLPSAYLREVFSHPGGLPEGWRSIRLEDIGCFKSGGTPSKSRDDYWGGNIPFVTGADITDINITAKNARAFLTKAGLESGKTAKCQPGTVLFVTRTRVGRVGLAREVLGASQDITPFICGLNILPEFLYRYLCCISDLLIESCRGATIQGLTRDFISNLEINLPSLPEQKRIAAILRERMEAVERARKSAEAQLSTINALPGALLRQAFCGEL